MVPPAASTRCRIFPKITFACSYSFAPWIVAPAFAREVMPATWRTSPTRIAFDHVPGAGSATSGLETRVRLGMVSGRGRERRADLEAVLPVEPELLHDAYAL